MSNKKFYAIRDLNTEGYITSDNNEFEHMMRESKGKFLFGKGFKTKEEAINFVSAAQYCAYTDCSYDIATGKCSYGYIIYNDLGELKCNYNSIETDTTGLANVYGELKAVMAAVEIGLQLGEKIQIYFDFNGVKYFLKNAKKKPNRIHHPFLKSYVSFMNINREHYELINVNEFKEKRIIHNQVHIMVRHMLREEIKS